MTMAKQTKIIRLDYASVPVTIPLRLMRKVGLSSENINRYPVEEIERLRQAIAKKEGVSKHKICLFNGLDEAIDIVTRVYGKTIMIPVPTFSQFEIAGKRNNSNIITINALSGDNYSLAFEDNLLAQPSLVWICNPNNPTGDIISQDVIVDIVKRTKAMVAVDEAYYRFSKITMKAFIDTYDNLLVLRSMSKDYGIAGLRIGYVISHPRNIAALEALRQPFNINVLACLLGKELLKYEAYFEREIEALKLRRDAFISRARALGYSIRDSCTNFFLISFPSQREAERFYNYLRRNNVLTLPSWNDEFSCVGNTSIRMCVGTSDEMDAVLSILQGYDGLVV